MTTIFLYQKDFTNKGRDRYFLYRDEVFLEKTAADICAEAELLICHDYWLIAPSLYAATQELPKNVLDVQDLKLAIGGEKVDRKLREQHTIADSIADICQDKYTLKNYIEIFHKKKDFESKIYSDIAPHIISQWFRLKGKAEEFGELNRYLEIELPVFNFLVMCSVKGVKVDLGKLRAHKKLIEHKYYTALKKFAVQYDFPFEVPSDEDVCDYLEPKGFDFSGVSLDFVLKFVPMNDRFADDLMELRKLSDSRHVLAGLPLGRQKAFPVVDIFGSVTSRIYYRDPALQNLSKQHRDIIIPDPGFELSYVDYDQFEIGIMAALSGDSVLKDLYEKSDLYLVVSEKVFGNNSMRKFSKRLFLSYAYGMKLKGLSDAAVSQGAERRAVHDFFKQFSVFEEWKNSIAEEFERVGKVGTEMGNYLIRKGQGKITEKERRSCVSQVVQGTASLIFKKALLKLRDETAVSVKIPMHDAVLVQHPPDYDVGRLSTIFAKVMTEHFKGAVKGKASLEQYFEDRMSVAHQ